MTCGDSYPYTLRPGRDALNDASDTLLRRVHENPQRIEAALQISSSRAVAHRLLDDR